MMIQLLVNLFMIHHRSFWEFKAYIEKVPKLADVVGEVVQDLHHQKVEIEFVDKMLRNLLLALRFIFMYTTTFCSCRRITPSWVTLLFLVMVQSKLLFQDF